MPILTALFTFLSGWAARLIGAGAIRAILWKGILYALVVSILPTVLYNLFTMILNEFLQIASSYGSSQHSIILTLTGLAGWLAIHLKIPQVFAMIFSALAFRVTISFIPFLSRI